MRRFSMKAPLCQHRAAITAVLVGTLTAAVQAQWDAIPLHHSLHRESAGYGIGPGVQGGYLNRFGSAVDEPTIWFGLPETAINLAPGALVSGRVNGIWGNQQAGELGSRAIMWSSTPESKVELHPTNYAASKARGIRGNQQVGDVTTPSGQLHAALWHGSAASFVDLHPPGAIQSALSSTDGTRQGGVVVVPGGASHAAIWSGTAASVIDLHPQGHLQSGILAMVPGQQVGHVRQILAAQAALWSGTPESLVILHPFPGIGQSFAYGTSGAVQVGAATDPATFSTHAALWMGSAASHLDLHQFLPTGYSSSAASAVWQDGDTVYVIGGAGNASTGRPEAWMWVGTIPAPSSLAPLGFTAFLAFRRRR
jgi:hypothetical protein